MEVFFIQDTVDRFMILMTIPHCKGMRTDFYLNFENMGQSLKFQQNVIVHRTMIEELFFLLI